MCACLCGGLRHNRHCRNPHTKKSPLGEFWRSGLNPCTLDRTHHIRRMLTRWTMSAKTHVSSRARQRRHLPTPSTLATSHTHRACHTQRQRGTYTQIDRLSDMPYIELLIRAPCACPRCRRAPLGEKLYADHLRIHTHLLEIVSHRPADLLCETMITPWTGPYKSPRRSIPLR